VKFRKFAEIGIFGRTYAVMLATIVVAQLLIFSMLVAMAPPVPPLTPVVEVAQILATGRVPQDRELSVKFVRSPPSHQDSPEARRLAALIQRASGVKASELVVRFAPLAPPSTLRIQPWNAEQLPPGSAVIAGDFTVARQVGYGRWLVLTTGDHFFDAVALRTMLVLLLTLAVVIPFAYWLAVRTAKPFQRFARAAEMVGLNPDTAVQVWNGPTEIRLAGESLNRMQLRLAGYVNDRTTMLTAIAHDLRTPLMRMMLQVERLPERERAPLVGQIRYMKDMIEGVLELIRDEQPGSTRVVFDFGATLEKLCHDGRDAGSPIECVIPSDQVLVIGDRVAIQRAIHNLIDNALKYGGKAKCRLAVRHHMAVLCVSDEGPGIPEDRLGHVIEPFVRLDEARGSETGGVGLGLSLVRRIVSSHGGQLELRNASTGLIAEIRIPLCQSPPRTENVGTEEDS